MVVGASAAYRREAGFIQCGHGVLRIDDRGRAAVCRFSPFDSPHHGIPRLRLQRVGALRHGLDTGDVPFEHVYGAHLYDYLGRNEVKNSRFSRFMEQAAEHVLVRIGVEAFYDFRGHVIDLGGNTGALSAHLLQNYPELNATVFDLEQAMIGAEERIAAAGVADRCRFARGNFFEPETIPADGDIYLLSRVLLNWSDSEAVEILQNIRQVMPDHAVLLVLDYQLPDTTQTAVLLASLNLWVLFGSRFRKRCEYERLVQQAGFIDLCWTEIDNDMTFYLEARVKAS